MDDHASAASRTVSPITGVLASGLIDRLTSAQEARGGQRLSYRQLSEMPVLLPSLIDG